MAETTTTYGPKDKQPKWQVKPFNFSAVKKIGQDNKTARTEPKVVNKEVKREDPIVNYPVPVIEEPKLGMGDLKQAEADSNVNFFDQKPPRNINDLYQTPQDNTRAPVYDYKRLEDKPITKKVYKERINNPENREPTFPISQPVETESGSYEAKDLDPELQVQEIIQKTEILNKINSGEINLPPFVSSLPVDMQLSYVGATYNNNPLYTSLSTLMEPLLHLDNLVRSGMNKAFDTDYKMLTPPNMSGEDEEDKLITGGTELLTALIPLGASIKGANYLLQGIKNPFIKKILSTGLGFVINSQPALLDNLQQGNMELKDYAIQSATDFATGLTFGAMPHGTPLKYDLPYQTIVPTMVPVISDLIQGKEINEKELVSGFLSNMVLGLVMSGQLSKDTPVKEFTRKVETELNKYDDSQKTPETVNKIIAGLLPPAREQNTETISRVKTGEKPTIEQVTVPGDRSRIVVDEKGTAKVEPEAEQQGYIAPIKLTAEQYADMKRNGLTPEQIQEAQDNLNNVKPIYKKTESVRTEDGQDNRITPEAKPEPEPVKQEPEREYETVTLEREDFGKKFVVDSKGNKFIVKAEKGERGIEFYNIYKKGPNDPSPVKLGKYLGRAAINIGLRAHAEGDMKLVDRPKLKQEAPEVKKEEVSDQEKKYTKAYDDMLDLRDEVNNVKSSDLSGRANKSKNIALLKKAVDIYNGNHPDNNAKIERTKYGNYNITINGKPLRRESVKREFDPETEANNIDNPNATKSFKELGSEEREVQRKIAENIIETGPALVKEKAKFDTPVKVLRKGLEDIKEDSGKELSAEAKIVREEMLKKTDNGAEYRTKSEDGQDNGIEEINPETEKPIKTTVSKVESVHQSNLNSAIEQKNIAKKKMQELKKQLDNEPLNGKRNAIRLDLLKWKSKYGEALSNENKAKSNIENRANELGMTTKKEPGKASMTKEAADKVGGMDNFTRGAKEFIEKNKDRKSLPDDKTTAEAFLIEEYRNRILNGDPEIINSTKKPATEELFEERKNIFDKMTLPQIEKHIESRVKEFKSRVDYLQSAEYKEIIKPLHQKLLNREATAVKKEVEYEKEKLKNKVITKGQYDAAIRGIKDRGKNMYSNPIDPAALKDLTVVGLYHLEKGLVKFGDWAKRMVKELGDKVRPHLKNIWAEINNPKNVKAFRENNPEAELHTSGPSMKLKDKDGQPENFEQYKKRIAKEYGTVPSREEYNDAKQLRVTSDELRNKEGQEKVKKEVEDVLDKVVNAPAKEKTLDELRSRTSKGKKNAPANELYMDKVYAKMNEIQADMEKRGYKGQSLMNQSEIQSIKHLFSNDPEFKKFKAEQKRAIVREVKNYYKEEYRKRTAANAVLGEEYADKNWWQNLKNSSFLQSRNHIARQGPSGKEMAERFKHMTDQERELMGEPSGLLLDIEGLTKAEKNNLEKIWEQKMNEQIPMNYLNDNVKNLDAKIDDYFENMANMYKERGFVTRNLLTGDIYAFTPKRDYRPRILNDKVSELEVKEDSSGIPKENKSREKVIDFLIETKQAKDRAGAAILLDNELSKHRIRKAGNVEYSRNEKLRLPDEYYVKNPTESLLAYAKKVSKRVAFVDAWGMEGQIFNRLRDDLYKEGKDYIRANDLFRYETGQLTANERKLIYRVNNVKAFMALTKFSPFTSLRNAFQGFLGTTTRGNLKAGFSGLVKSLDPVMKKHAYEAGVMADNLEGIFKDTIGANNNNFLGNLTTKYLDLIKFTATDRYNRVISAVGGLTFMEDMLKRIEKDSVWKKRAAREFKKLEIDPDKVIENGGFTKAEKDKIMRTFAFDSQFSLRPQDLPLWWSSPQGKLVTQWKPWGYKMTQLIRDNVIAEVKHGNVMPLITMLTAYGVTGETVNYLIDNIRSVANFNPKEDDNKNETPNEKSLIGKINQGDIGGAFERAVNDLAGLGALSLYWDIIRSFGYGKVGEGLSVVAGPAYAEAGGIIENVLGPGLKKLSFKSNDDWEEVTKKTIKGLYKSTAGNVPGAGTFRTLGMTKAFEEYLFKNDGPEFKDDSIIGEYYKGLDDPGKEEVKKIKEMEKDLKAFREQVLSNPTKELQREFQRKESEIKRYKDKSRVWYNYTKLKSTKEKEEAKKLGK